MTMVTAILNPKPGHADALIAALHEVAEHTRREAGVLAYAIGRREDGSLVVAEQYIDRDACDVHFAAPYVSGLLARFPELLDGDPQVEFAETVSSFVS
ncbi:putative quinol monooxygenase [Rhodococcus sp. UNC363MFTsu5.1]|uniref:putative quinol monooxygenase n=1 Tax=Rhodococcus sp. UNC363MFTsu5.1 TaxID=1449069 RepID=UPI00068986F9|nr:putative quinol monooxygenase [Rhodococcus sp. UNC363MFTsu5.1]